MIQGLHIGRMPVVCDKSRLKDGKIIIIYNPEGAKDFPGLNRVITNSLNVMIAYAFNGDWNKKVETPMLLTSFQGMYVLELEVRPGQYMIEFSFTSPEGGYDPVCEMYGQPANYREWLFTDSQGSPVIITDSHCHLSIGLDVQGMPRGAQHYLLPALLSGGMERAMIVCRDADWLCDMLGQFPQLRAMPWVHPRDGDVQQTIDCITENPGIVGMKFHPCWDKSPINSPEYARYLDALSLLCHTQGIRYNVLTHSGNHDEPGYVDPDQVREVAGKYPGINFILGHVYLGDDWGKQREMAFIARDYPNVYLETSWLNPWERVLEVIKIAGAGKVLFGSDTQGLEHYRQDYDHYCRQVKYLAGVIEGVPQNMRLSQDDFALVMCQNARRLFGFTGDSFVVYHAPIERVDDSGSDPAGCSA
ncbi:MAG: amidohydrolase [Candidatus Aureabacteria bacterium]|nr:amidohydrolase [Candidatus Auribacterota bacterium]